MLQAPRIMAAMTMRLGIGHHPKPQSMGVAAFHLAALAGVEPAVAVGALQASLPERTPMCAPPAATLLCCRAVQ